MPIGISVVAGRDFGQRLLKISEILSGPLMAEGGWGAEKLESTGRTILAPNGSCNLVCSRNEYRSMPSSSGRDID